MAVVTMADGKANAMDTAMCRELAGQFGELGGGHRAVVLTAQPRTPVGRPLMGRCNAAITLR